MGLDVNGVLEVTHSFPMPKNQDSEDFEGKQEPIVTKEGYFCARADA